MQSYTKERSSQSIQCGQGYTNAHKGMLRYDSPTLTQSLHLQESGHCTLCGIGKHLWVFSRSGNSAAVPDPGVCKSAAGWQNCCTSVGACRRTFTRHLLFCVLPDPACTALVPSSHSSSQLLAKYKCTTCPTYRRASMHCYTIMLLLRTSIPSIQSHNQRPITSSIKRHILE